MRDADDALKYRKTLRREMFQTLWEHLSPIKKNGMHREQSE